MKTKRLKLALIGLALGLFASTKLSAQDRPDRRADKEPPSTAEIFKEMDKDEDGLLSTKEVKGPLKNDFTKIDANEDGFLSKEEVEKAPKPKRGQRKQ